jgi:transcription elongation factor GreB
MPTHLTSRGARLLATELQRLTQVERPRVVQEVADAAAQGDRSENAEYIYGKKRLPTKRDKVFFGAIVQVEDEDGKRLEYQLVGSDEANPAMGLISYQSPMGKALLGKRVGDAVTFVRPLGETEVEILAIRYGVYLDEERAVPAV